jgi:hypothetical protein
MYNPFPMQTRTIKKLLRFTFYSLPLFAFALHGKGPEAEAVSSRSVKNFSLPVKVTIYKSHRAQLASLSHSEANPLKLQSGRPTVQEVKSYVRTQALEYGVNPTLALWIVKHESQFNPHAKGDGEASRGLWQISRIYHPEVSDAMAFNVASSTEWSLERIRSGKVNEWSTYRFCRTLYEDCPF